MMKALTFTAAALVALAPAAAPAVEAPPPAGQEIVTLQLASGPETLYRFTADQFPATPKDPVNLVFEGAADPREVRAALISVDGNRAAYELPAFAPFDCTWTDAEGEEQATWTEGSGWEGGAIQLSCGSYAARFHLRLFRHGGRTLGGVHMDVQVPGTTDHQAVGWNLPQRIVEIDLERAGLLGGRDDVAVPGATPTFRAMPWYVHYYFFLYFPDPVQVRALLELPLEDVYSGEIPLPWNGSVKVLSVLSSFVPAQSDASRHFVVEYDQGGAKPFCNPDGTELVWVKGPVHFDVRVQTNPSGKYLRTVTISAVLDVTPLNPPGPTVKAFIFENHRGMLTDNHAEVTWVLGQSITDISQVLSRSFAAGQHDNFSISVECGTPAP
jgi:hypothetical protein